MNDGIVLTLFPLIFQNVPVSVNLNLIHTLINLEHRILKSPSKSHGETTLSNVFEPQNDDPEEDRLNDNYNFLSDDDESEDELEQVESVDVSEKITRDAVFKGTLKLIADSICDVSQDKVSKYYSTLIKIMVKTITLPLSEAVTYNILLFFILFLEARKVSLCCFIVFSMSTMLIKPVSILAKCLVTCSFK